MSPASIQPAPVRKTLIVKADATRSFATFTRGIGKWWPRSHSIGSSPQADVVLESRAGGRWYERGQDGAECEWGKVITWDPPSRLVLAWQIDANWKYDPTLITEVEITFTPLSANETRIELEHRHLERFGDAAEQVRAAVDSPRGWTGVLESYAEFATTGQKASP
jgi:uncharacterized protein YndB with AHSA1/START domain